MRTVLVSLLLSGVVAGLASACFAATSSKWINRYTAGRRLSVWVLLTVASLVPFSLFARFAPLRVELSQPTVTIETSTRVPGTYVPTQPLSGTPEEEQASANVTQPSGQLGYRIYLYAALAAVWGAGALAFLSLQWAQYRYWRRRVGRWSEPVTDETLLAFVEQAKDAMHCKKTVRVVTNPQVGGPMVVGVFRPTLVLPEGFAGRANTDMVLRHELGHVAGRDIPKKMLFNLARAVHWFNPLVHDMARMACREIELACDERVVAGQGDEYRYAYSAVLLTYAGLNRQNRAPACSTCFSDNKKSIQRRFGNILDSKPRRAGLAVAAGALAVVILILSLVLVQPAQRQNARILLGEAQNSDVVVVTGKNSYMAALPFAFEDYILEEDLQYAATSVGSFVSVINAAEDRADGYIAVYTSEDKGKHWRKTSVDVLGHIDGLGNVYHGFITKEDGYLFVSGTQGSLTNSGLFLYRTRDSAKTWAPVRFVPGWIDDFMCAGFLDEQTAVICTSTADEGLGLLVSQDGGNTWIDADLSGIEGLLGDLSAYSYQNCDYTDGFTLTLARPGGDTVGLYSGNGVHWLLADGEERGQDV